LPSWQYTSIKEVALIAIEANKAYFTSATGHFTGNIPTELDYKIARKNAFVALSNLSEALQRMLSDPKSRQHALKDYHQFAVAHHTLTSYIASITYYAGQFTNKFEGADFIPIATTINRQFDQLLILANDNDTADPVEIRSFPFNKRVEKLLTQRKKQITEGINDSETRKTLSELKSITDQFMLIHAVLNDEIKIFKKINETI